MQEKDRPQRTRNEESDWARFLRAEMTGRTFDAVVTSITTFGAFVQVDEGIEGLVHTSVLSQPPSLGDQLRVQIDDIDIGERKLSLRPVK